MSSLQESKSKCWKGDLTKKNVNQEFKHLRQLVLIEQFKICIHAEIKTHLDERVDNLQDAASTADDYALTHKLSSISTGGPNKSSQNYKNNSNRSNQSKLPNSQGTIRSEYSVRSLMTGK